MSNNSEQKLVRFDWAMKNILRNKANFDILEGFLTCLLNENITVKKIYDIKNRNVIECVTSENTPRIISVNVVYHSAMTDENKDYIYCSSVDVIGRHSKKPFLAKLNGLFTEYYIIYVENFKGEIKEKIDEWMYFFSTAAIKPGFNAPGIKEAEKKLNYLAMTKEEQEEYARYADAVRYEEDVLYTAVSEGELRGELRGIEIGEQRGKLEGELKGKLETAAQMLSDGVSVENISKWTGLASDEILALKKHK